MSGLVERALAAWRAAEKRLAEAEIGTPQHAAAELEVERSHAAYRDEVEAARATVTTEGAEVSSPR
jgi:hypothetical protein